MKIPKPWFRKQTGSWYVQIGGVQHPLGGDKKEADRAFHRLMESEGLAKPMKELPLIGLVEQFLADREKTVKPDNANWYRTFLDDFAGRYPGLKPIEIAPRHVRAWLNADRKRKWGQSTHRSAITILKRLLNLGVENKLLVSNPIADFERPPATARDRLLTEAERQRILSFYPEGDVFHDFLIAMMESGCRPGEVASVEAKHVDLAIGAWTCRGRQLHGQGTYG